MKPLPNVRKLFKPDPGHIICDVDLSGADAQVVAWEAGDERLKAAFKAGIDVHNMNGTDMFGADYDPERYSARKGTMRDELKAAVHGTDYIGGARTIAKDLGWPIQTVRQFQAKWFDLHPAIGGANNPFSWHRRVDKQLQTTRSVTNRFGYRIVYFDRPDNLLPKGLAWIPQSTIAVVAGRAAVRFNKYISWAQLLSQVHDSLIFQVPTHRFTVKDFAEIREAIAITIPYDDPLTIPWGLKTSDRSWGDAQKRKWEEVG